MNTRSKILSIFIVLMLVLAVPASAAFQFSSFKFNRQDFPTRFSKDKISDKEPLEIANLFPSIKFNRPDFPLRISKDKISNEEALEIAKSYGLEDPCCPLAVKPASIEINGVWMAVVSVSNACGPILYLDPYSGEVVDDGRVLACVCVCVEKQGLIFTAI